LHELRLRSNPNPADGSTTELVFAKLEMVIQSGIA
jgi:hypothetical protein